MANKPENSLESVERVFSKPFNGKILNRDNNWKLSIAAMQKELANGLSGNRILLEECPVCESSESSHWATVFDYEYQICTNCSHIRCSTPAAHVDIGRLYDDTGETPKSVQSVVYTDPSIIDERIRSIALPKVEFVTQRLDKKGKWIDIGCGIGDLVIAASVLGWDSWGVESDPVELRTAIEKGARVHKAFLTSDTIGEFVIDASVISFVNVLEHIPEPIKFLKSAVDASSEGTIVVIEVPRHPSLSSLSNKMFPDHAHRHIYPPDHLHIFSEESMSLMLKECGLCPKTVWCFGQDIAELFSSICIHWNIEGDDIALKIAAATNELQSVIDRHFLSDTMFVIAQKGKQ